MEKIYIMSLIAILGIVMVSCYPIDFERLERVLEYKRNYDLEQDNTDSYSNGNDSIDSSEDYNNDSNNNKDESPTDENGRPDYGKGKMNQIFDLVLGGWSPKKIYNEKIRNNKAYKILFD